MKIVTTTIDDPEYLTQEFVLSSQFKKESDQSKWHPRPCEVPPPTVVARAAAIGSATVRADGACRLTTRAAPTLGFSAIPASDRTLTS